MIPSNLHAATGSLEHNDDCWLSKVTVEILKALRTPANGGLRERHEKYEQINAADKHGADRLP